MKLAIKAIRLITVIMLANLIACTNVNRDFSEQRLIELVLAEPVLKESVRWQESVNNTLGDETADGWLASLNDVRLLDYVQLALSNNRDIQAEAANLAAVFESNRTVAASRKPTVGGSIQQTISESAATGDYDTSYRASLNVSWEVDIWSRLSDENKAAVLSAEATEANYQAAKLSLVANVARQWFSINADQLKLEIAEKRLANQKNALSIIEEQYKSGRGEAIDVFLSRSELAAQQSSLLNARNQLEQSIRTFKRVLGHYPDIDLDFAALLPELNQTVPAGLSSDLLKRRPDVLASMKTWQAAVLDISSADKARFPSFALTASYGASSDELLQIDAGDFLFNLVNNLTVPLFQGGRLKAQLRRAEYLADARYQNYVSTLLSSFEEVESALSAETYLKQQLTVLEQAESFAKSGYELAFEQYQSGLIRYTNLLDFESRWFTTQSDIITLRNSLLQNRIALYLALGGDFA